MSEIIELFGKSVSSFHNWNEVVRQQHCPFRDKPCYKTRKSNPSIAIGTCSVKYGKALSPIIICPARLLQGHQIFLDCIHLLADHEVGNELHVLQEVGIPGGSVDFFLASVKAGVVMDFVGIEIQTMDTTGTIWPQRQKAIELLGVDPGDREGDSTRAFGMNWKMTSKTILVQMHHKISTFQHLGKKLVLVLQDDLLSYMKREFRFEHLSNPVRFADSLHLHAYRFGESEGMGYSISLISRLSTDADCIGECLGLQAEARVNLEDLLRTLAAKVNSTTRLKLVTDI